MVDRLVHDSTIDLFFHNVVNEREAEDLNAVRDSEISGGEDVTNVLFNYTSHIFI